MLLICFVIFFTIIQVSTQHIKLQLGAVSLVSFLVGFSACFILFSYFSSIPTIKKNLLTRLDELLVLTFTLFVCLQCSICLFSLAVDWRNDYLYIVFYVLLYGCMIMGFGIWLALNCARVFIILWVSKRDNTMGLPSSL